MEHKKGSITSLHSTEKESPRAAVRSMNPKSLPRIIMLDLLWKSEKLNNVNDNHSANESTGDSQNLDRLCSES